MTENALRAGGLVAELRNFQNSNGADKPQKDFQTRKWLKMLL